MSEGKSADPGESPKTAEKSFQNFRAFVRKILAVPKAEAQARDLGARRKKA